MTKHLIAIWLATPLLVAGILTANIVSVRPGAAHQPVIVPAPPTAESGVARITSALLARKLRELRLRAIRLQLREEGRELIEEGLAFPPAGGGVVE